MFESPSAALARADVAFLTVGGLAVAQAGYPRFTEYIDVLVEGTPDNLDRLISVFSTFGEGASPSLRPKDRTDVAELRRILREQASSPADE